MLHVIDHPVIKHKLTLMKCETGTKISENLDEIGGLMTYTKDFYKRSKLIRLWEKRWVQTR